MESLRKLILDIDDNDCKLQMSNYENITTLVLISKYQGTYNYNDFCDIEEECKKITHVDLRFVNIIEEYSLTVNYYFVVSENKFKLLSHLNISGIKIESYAFKSLAQSKTLGLLKELISDFNDCGEKGANYLAENKTWIHLEKLSLVGNSLGTKGGKELAKNKSWCRLSYLDISYNKIGYEVESIVVKNKIWNLTKLISNNNEETITDQEITDLKTQIERQYYYNYCN